MALVALLWTDAHQVDGLSGLRDLLPGVKSAGHSSTSQVATWSQIPEIVGLPCLSLTTCDLGHEMACVGAYA